MESSAPTSAGGLTASLFATAPAAKQVQDYGWSFIADSVSTVPGDTVGLPPAVASRSLMDAPSLSLAPQTTPSMQRSGQSRRRGTRFAQSRPLPDLAPASTASSVIAADDSGSGPGLHIFRLQAEGSAAAPTTSPAAPASPLRTSPTAFDPSLSPDGLTISRALVTSLDTCTGSPLCDVTVGAPKGTFLVRASVDGQPLSASARAGDVPPKKPTLVVDCPTSATRGDDVTCSISLSPNTLPFTVTKITSTVHAGAVVTLAFSPMATNAAGAVYKVTGPAVASTQVSVQASITWQGNTTELDQTATVGVTPRAPELSPYIMTLAPEAMGPLAGANGTTPYPNFSGAYLGRYKRREPDWSQVMVQTATTGIDAGLSYVVSVPGIPASWIYMTMALYPGSAWYDAHPKVSGERNGYGDLICTQSQIDGLRMQVERHEGMTMASDSHYGIDQALLTKWQLGREFGGTVGQFTGSAQYVRQQMAATLQAEWQREDDALSPLQDAFDAVDLPAVLNSLGCSIIVN